MRSILMTHESDKFVPPGTFGLIWARPKIYMNNEGIIEKTKQTSNLNLS